MPKVSAKSKCCKDKPRCTKCPVTLKRLADAGFGERVDRLKYDMDKKIPKSAVKAARSR